MSNSPNLSLPYIMPAQAQKHVTHNLAIEQLDALVHLILTETNAASPPSDPFEGQVVGVADDAGGAFEGQGGMLAFFAQGGWTFFAPRTGFLAWSKADNALCVHQDGRWRELDSTRFDNIEGMGINTAWDEKNRLSVASGATLLNHGETGDHRLKINKAERDHVSSLLFQSGFSGRAEIGLSGSDALTLKVSADGNAWSTALSVDEATGEAAFGRISAEAVSGAAVQSAPDDTTPGRLMRADWGYGPGNVMGPVTQDGGQATGALFERGANARGSYVRTADGRVEIIASILVDTTHTGTQQFALPTALTNVIHAVSVSNVGSNPNVAIRPSNIRMVRVAGSSIQLRLDTAFSPSGDANNDTLMCLVNGYWY